MHYINTYEDSLNRYKSTDILSENISILNRMEELIPFQTRLDLDLSVYVSLDPMAMLEYHKEFLKGNSMLITKALGSFSKNQINSLNESLKELKDALRSALNESSSITDSDANIMKNVLSNVDNTLDKSGIDQSKKGGFLKLLNDLYNSLTEGGSTIGILHFLLDIVGLLGDGVMAATGLPVGIIADFLNGVIYMVRAVNGDSSKYMLAIVSFIAAVIPFGGDVMKGLIKGSKSGKQLMRIGTTYFKPGGKIATGTAKISDDAVKLVSEASPKTIEALEYISKSSGKTIPAIRNYAAKIFDGLLSNIIGWIPFIGKPLKSFFKSIGKMIRGFSDDVAKFSDDIPKIIKEAEVRQLDDFFKASTKQGATITKKGNNLVIRNTAGEVKEIPASLLLRKNIIKKRFGGAMSSQIDDLLKRSDLNIADFYESLAKNVKYFKRNIYNKPLSIGSKKFIPRRSWMIFLGKQIMKMVNGKDTLGEDIFETEAVGLSAFSKIFRDAQNKEITQDKNRVYSSPSFNSHLDDNTSYDIINKQLNYNSKMLGLPEIEYIPYYSKSEDEKWPEGLKEFMEAGIDPSAESFKKMEETFNKPSKNKKFKRVKKVQEAVLTHLVPFSKFIKA
jgi:hypothetical protein